MPSVTYRTRIEAPAEEVFAWHERPGALERLTPPWAPVTVERSEGIRNGSRTVLKVGVGPARLTWVAEHRDYVAGRQFRDVQVKGPFERWQHTHRMDPDGPDACFLKDHVEYEMPLGHVGEHYVRQRMERLLAYRHRVLRRDLAAHRAYGQGRRLRIAISGSHGLVGSQLIPFLTTGGHDVVRLVRTPAGGAQDVYWNHRDGRIEAAKLEGLDVVVHLAAENIFGLRWTEGKKAKILASRSRGTELIAQTLAGLNRPPAVFLSASAIGYYGSKPADVLTEDAPPGERGFLAAVTREWEAAAQPAVDAGIRTVRMRTAVILSPAGGALQLMLPVFRMGLGAYVGGANPYFSWIGMDDYIHALYHAMWTEALEGPVNFASPNPVTLESFTKTVGEVLSRPVWLKAPAALVRLVSGEAADEMILASQRVHPKRLLDSGYVFHYPDLEDALRHETGAAG